MATEMWTEEAKERADRAERTISYLLSCDSHENYVDMDDPDNTYCTVKDGFLHGFCVDGKYRNTLYFEYDCSRAVEGMAKKLFNQDLVDDTDVESQLVMKAPQLYDSAGWLRWVYVTRGDMAYRLGMTDCRSKVFRSTLILPVNFLDASPHFSSAGSSAKLIYAFKSEDESTQSLFITQY